MWGKLITWHCQCKKDQEKPFLVIKNISYQILSHGESEGDRKSRVRDENAAGQVSASELAAEVGTRPKGELVAEVGAVKFVQV